MQTTRLMPQPLTADEERACDRLLTELLAELGDGNLRDLDTRRSAAADPDRRAEVA
jgi:hypothetical protein